MLIKHSLALNNYKIDSITHYKKKKGTKYHNKQMYVPGNYFMNYLS